MAVLGLYGHAPSDVRTMPWRDVQLMLAMHTMIHGGA